MKKLMFTLACAASAAVMAGLQTTADFEDDAFVAGTTKAATLVGMTDKGEVEGDMFWTLDVAGDSAVDESVVTAHGAASLPDGVDGGSNYLKLETNGDELRRKVLTDDTPKPVGDGLYIDTLVQFTATPDSSSVSIDAGAKLAIWLEGEDTYTLKVAGAQLTLDSNSMPIAISKTYTVSGSYQPETWYRLTVKAVPTLTTGFIYPAFQIFINGNPVTVDAKTCDDACIAFITDTAKAWASGMDTLVADKKVILSGACAQDGYQNTVAATLTSVGFQGSGAIDNVTITDADPLVVTPTSVEFTITLGDNVSSVTYTVSDGEGGTLSETGTFDVNIGATVTVTAVTADDWYTYTVAPQAAVTASAEDNSIAVMATKVEVTDGALPEGTTAADLGIKTGAFASANTAALAPVVKWAQAYGKTPADINAMTFGTTPYTQTEAAYLFNCADSEAAVDKEKEEFKLTITFDENGAPVVSGPEGKTYNGTVEVKGKASLSDAEWAAKDDTKHKFFKAFLTK